MFNHDSKTL